MFGRLAGAGAGPASPASQCQPLAVASSLQSPAGLDTFKNWRQCIVAYADFKFSNSNYHASVYAPIMSVEILHSKSNLAILSSEDTK